MQDLLYIFDKLLNLCDYFSCQSLCNACGIRYRKRRRAILGSYKGDQADDYRSCKRKTVIRSGGNGTSKLGMSLKLGLMAIQTDVVLKEEEQAAIMLMALSSGSVE